MSKNEHIECARFVRGFSGVGGRLVPPKGGSTNLLPHPPEAKVRTCRNCGRPLAAGYWFHCSGCLNDLRYMTGGIDE